MPCKNRPKYHRYDDFIIQLALSLVLRVGVSFRAASKIFCELHLCLHLNLGTPTHTTILLWTKKQGVGNFREKEYFNTQKWILIADESIQFGNKKLLFVIAVPVSMENKGSYLQYNDIIPLKIKVSTSWKAEEIAEVIKNAIDIKQVEYAVSDLGSNLTKAFSILNIKHIEDINHKFSWMMQHLFEEDETFKNYTKELSDMRAKLSMSKYARIVPPNQRIMSRYMNLTPLFKWGVKMLKLLENNYLTEEECEKLKFLPQYKTFILETYELLCSMNQIQKIMKKNGMSKASINEALQLFDTQNNANAEIIKSKFIEYVHQMQLRVSGRECVICSSDIIESCFGKYKELVKTNKSVGISDLSLCISAMLGNNSNLKKQFETVSIDRLKEWKKENIGETLFGEKINLMKKVA